MDGVVAYIGDYPKCPYCDYVFWETYRLQNNDSIKCPNCSNEYFVERIIRYKTRKVDFKFPT